MEPVTQKTPERMFDLSEREIEVLSGLADGQIVHEISRQLKLSDNTVKFHLGRIYKKMDVHTQAGAVGKGIRNKII